MMEKRTLLLIVLGMLLLGSARAQEINFEELRQEDADLNGKSSVVFVASTDDWVIETSKKSLDNISDAKKNPDGEYEYRIELDVSLHADRQYTLSRRGSAVQNSVKKLCRPNRRLYIRVEENRKEHIGIQKQEKQAGGYFVEGMGCMEFTTAIENLKVENKYWKFERTKASSGADVISVIVNVRLLTETKSKLDEVREAIAVLDAKPVKEKTLEDLDKLEELENKRSELEEMYGDMSSVTLYADGTNVLHEPVNLSVKEKQAYAVLMLTKTIVKEFSFAELEQDARDKEEQRDFFAAAEAFKAARNHKDCPEQRKAQLENMMGEMNSCRKFEFMAEKFIKDGKRVELAKGFDNDSVFIFYRGAVRCYNALLEKYPGHTPFVEERDRLAKILEPHPQNIKQYTVITGKAYRGGMDIYPSPSEKKPKGINNIKPLGRTAGDGSYRIVIQDISVVPYLYFFGEGYSRPTREIISHPDIRKE
ncbi:MAG: hypothetical protein LBR26_13880 [Prevotella sp.]|jgi:hypothetical protein|nr:hypothetical protein [Prevotella sp.]